MAGYGLAYGFESTVEAPLAGGLVGGGQVAVLTLANANKQLGEPVAKGIFVNNAELINATTGGLAIGAVTLAAAGHGQYLRSHPKTNAAVLTYGIVTLTGGWVVPRLVAWLQKKKSSSAQGRFAYLPSEPPRAQAAEVYGSGITSQANQQVLRRLFASPF